MAYPAGTKIRLIDCPVEGARDLGEVFEAAEPRGYAVGRPELQAYLNREGIVTHCPLGYWELAGPVVTETVTKTRIVPGVYDGVTVGRGQLDKPNGKRVEVTFDYWATADELDAAAAVLSALAKGLRDAN